MKKTLFLLLVLSFVILSACTAQSTNLNLQDGDGERDLSHLTDLQYKVTQEDATEPPFQNEFWDNHEEGIYTSVVTGEALFSSSDKYDSGTGWPAFTKTINEEAVIEKTDFTLTENTENYQVFNAKYFNVKTEVTQHVSFMSDFQYSNQFGKLAFEFAYRKLFNDKRSINLVNDGSIPSARTFFTPVND